MRAGHDYIALNMPSRGLYALTRACVRTKYALTRACTHHTHVRIYMHASQTRITHLYAHLYAQLYARIT